MSSKGTVAVCGKKQYMIEGARGPKVCVFQWNVTLGRQTTIMLQTALLTMQINTKRAREGGATSRFWTAALQNRISSVKLHVRRATNQFKTFTHVPSKRILPWQLQFQTP